MVDTKPWDSGNIPGPLMAEPLTPEIAVNLIQSASRPLLIVGAKLLDIEVRGRKLIDYAIELGRKGVHVVTTAHVIGEFLRRNYSPDASMPLANITDRLKDIDWKGVDGEGRYDLVVFLGFHYYLESQMLSTLKHFAPSIRRISLDREFQPNAEFSFPNLNEDIWKEELERIVDRL